MDGIAARIVNAGTTEGWVIDLTSRPLYPQEKSPQYPLDRRLGGALSHSGHSGKGKNSQPRNLIIQPVA